MWVQHFVLLRESEWIAAWRHTNYYGALIVLSAIVGNTSMLSFARYMTDFNSKVCWTHILFKLLPGFLFRIISYTLSTYQKNANVRLCIHSSVGSLWLPQKIFFGLQGHHSHLGGGDSFLTSVKFKVTCSVTCFFVNTIRYHARLSITGYYFHRQSQPRTLSTSIIEYSC